MTSPTVTFQNITFSDDSTIQLDSTDVVVFVGPNNAGKSLALRELEGHVSSEAGSKVVKSADLLRAGTGEGFSEYFRKHVQITNRRSKWLYTGYGFSFQAGDVSSLWPDLIQRFRQFFCLRISTETRITDSNPADSIALLDEHASHPIHMLYLDDELEHRIGDYFRRAFGEDLILDRAGGRTWPLLVGKRLSPLSGEDRISKTYLERLRASTVPLSQQGDGMRSFASVVLHLLAPITPSILLLDEPEAFLHPPQARLLGELMATEKSSRAQLFLATHSSDVLHGLINVAPDHLRVLRMQREGDVNRIRELDKGHIKKISSDPLMKYSSVMSGVFHERVIICEADSDCMFYSSILDLPEVHGGRQPDVLFVHANGKDRISTLAEALVALDVPVEVVVDMDVLKTPSVLKAIIAALGGDWATAAPQASAVKTAIEERKLGLSSFELREGVKAAVDEVLSEDDAPRRLESRIKALFREATPWDVVKTAGQSALPPGEATQHFKSLQVICKQLGLWIVPVGELEGFCKSIGGHGASWVQQVLERGDLATEPDLESAREFVSEIWKGK